jgi:molybdopterin synthase catalytic subunit
LTNKYDGWFISTEIVKDDYLITLIQELSSLTEKVQIGAFTTFTGVVRDISDKSTKKVTSLEIEHWEEQGDFIMKRIAERIGEKHQLLGLRIVHVFGCLNLSDPIVFVVIGSIHRKEAFKALDEVINAYKNESPVWKKEIYEDNTSDWIKTANISKSNA